MSFLAGSIIGTSRLETGGFLRVPPLSELDLMEPIRSALAELAAEMVTTITPALVHLAKETNRDLARFVGEQIAHALENSDQELNA